MVRRISGTRGADSGDDADSLTRAPAGSVAAIRWNDLSDDERTALKRLNRGPYSGLDEATAQRLLALGLVASRPAGVGISRAGRELVIATLLAGREGAAEEAK